MKQNKKVCAKKDQNVQSKKGEGRGGKVGGKAINIFQ